MFLAGDVGGTKVRLALLDTKGSWQTEERFISAQFNSLSEIVRAFGAKHKLEVKAACFGVAGPVEEGRCQATNLPWVIDSRELSKELKGVPVWLLNDLEANAYGIEVLNSKDIFVLNEGRERRGNGALISAGTGLGEAGLFWNGKKRIPFACEGGHGSFAPESEVEVELWRHLKHRYAHLSFERILSGRGIGRLYDFVVETGLETPFGEEMQDEDRAKVISERALTKSCPACMRALDLFIGIYAGEAGNLALKMFAIGGIYIGGGIAPKIVPLIDPEKFMERFSRKGRLESLLKEIPVKLIMNDKAALIGAAHYAQIQRD